MRPTRIKQQTRIQEPPIQERARKAPPLMAEEVEEKKTEENIEQATQSNQRTTYLLLGPS